MKDKAKKHLNPKTISQKRQEEKKREKDRRGPHWVVHAFM
jgi:hypothetical protein